MTDSITVSEHLDAELAAARSAGRLAHALGRSAAPALDATVREQLAGLPVGSERGMAAMRAFSAGYQAGVDAEVAALLAETA